MTKTTTPYDISITETERRKSGDSSTSEFSTLRHAASEASSTSTSESIPTHYGRSSSLEYDLDEPPVYSPTADSQDHDEMVSAKKMEEERRMRIKDYAMEISRLMGRQLVNGLKGGNGKTTHASTLPRSSTGTRH